MLGIAQAGGVFVNINPLLREPQVRHIILDCSISMLVGNMGELESLGLPRVDFTFDTGQCDVTPPWSHKNIPLGQLLNDSVQATGTPAIENDLAIIPVINKIDLPVTRVDEVLEEIETVLGLDPYEALLISAKEGIGIEDVFEAIIKRIPAPSGKMSDPLRALVFDSKYDTYRGVMISVRVMEGSISKGQKIQLMKGGTTHDVIELGQFRPQMTACETLGPGQVGYVLTGIKQLETVESFFSFSSA